MAPNQPLCEIDNDNQLAINSLILRLLTSIMLHFEKSYRDFFISQNLSVIFNNKLRLIEFFGFFFAAIAKMYRTLVVAPRLKVQFKLWEFYALLQHTNRVLAREILSSNTDSHIKSSII